SKYGVRRFIKGFLDLLTVKFLTGFRRRPQHLLGTFGLLSFLLGVLGLAYLAVTWVIRLWYPESFPPLHERPALIYALAALILAAFGLAVGRILSAELVYEPSLSNAAGEANPTKRNWPPRRPIPMPTFSSNDRSRWATVRALVDDGTFVVGRRDRTVVLAGA